MEVRKMYVQYATKGKAGSHCTVAVFNESYASSTSTAECACADTANGGFNNTTNPPA